MEVSWRTFTGISWVMTVSRSRGPAPVPPTPAPRLSVSWGKSGSETPMALFPVVQEEARIVSARRGVFPFLVRRS